MQSEELKLQGKRLPLKLEEREWKCYHYHLGPGSASAGSHVAERILMVSAKRMNGAAWEEFVNAAHSLHWCPGT